MLSSSLSTPVVSVLPETAPRDNRQYARRPAGEKSRSTASPLSAVLQTFREGTVTDQGLICVTRENAMFVSFTPSQLYCTVNYADLHKQNEAFGNKWLVVFVEKRAYSNTW